MSPELKAYSMYLIKRERERSRCPDFNVVIDRLPMNPHLGHLTMPWHTGTLKPRNWAVRLCPLPLLQLSMVC